MTNKPAAEWVDTSKLTPWRDNPRKNDHAVDAVVDSIKRFGFASPIIARMDGEVIAGHTRLKAALKLGLDRVPVRYMDLDPADAKLLALADNRVGEIADWDDDMLADVLAELADDGATLAGLGWSDDELAGIIGMEIDGEEAYTAKVESPIYEMKGDRPDESELFSQERTDSLTEQIESADIDDDSKRFLIAAAQRHTVFQYDKIAEYYAHAPASVQRLMEDSALVIIDFDRAIELGFVKLTGEIAEAYREDHE
ncbi:MAG TPA: hypothetical protein EYN66_02535 [Myxococcales bacterium]|nr:hypothetical protein [Myxococcales bacterium]